MLGRGSNPETDGTEASRGARVHDKLYLKLVQHSFDITSKSANWITQRHNE